MTMTPVDIYLAALSPDQERAGQVMRRTIRQVLPDAEECMRYKMPCYRVKAVPIIYFAVWKKHVSLYPVYRGTASFEAEVSPYRAKKDTVQFALDRPLPEDLIALIVRSQADKTG